MIAGKYETLRLVLISHAATAAMRRGQLPRDDLLDACALDAIRRWPRGSRLPADGVALVSPAPCAVATAQALGLTAQCEPALAELDFGAWKGRRFSELAEEQPQALQDWLSDPAMAAHGGESFLMALRRAGQWMDQLQSGHPVIAVTHASIIRACVMHALNVEPSSFRHIEIAPLTCVQLQRNQRGWVWLPASD